MVSTAANHANEAMKKIDQFKQLLEIQESLGGAIDLVSPTRELVKEGKIVKISARSGDHQERYLFLVKIHFLYYLIKNSNAIYFILYSSLICCCFALHDSSRIGSSVVDCHHIEYGLVLQYPTWRCWKATTWKRPTLSIYVKEPKRWSCTPALRKKKKLGSMPSMLP